MQAGTGTQPCAPLPPAAQQCHSGGLRQDRVPPKTLANDAPKCFLFSYQRAGHPPLLLAPQSRPHYWARPRSPAQEDPRLWGGSCKVGTALAAPPPHTHTVLTRVTRGLLSKTSLKKGLQPEPAPLTWPGPPGAGLQGHREHSHSRLRPPAARPDRGQPAGGGQSSGSSSNIHASHSHRDPAQVGRQLREGQTRTSPARPLAAALPPVSSVPNWVTTANLASHRARHPPYATEVTGQEGRALPSRLLRGSTAPSAPPASVTRSPSLRPRKGPAARLHHLARNRPLASLSQRQPTSLTRTAKTQPSQTGNLNVARARAHSSSDWPRVSGTQLSPGL